MTRPLPRATGLARGLLLAVGLCSGPGTALAQASWIRIGDPPDPPAFDPSVGAVCDSLGDRLLVFRPQATRLGNPAAAAEVWEFRLGEPERGWRLLDAQGEAPVGRFQASTVFDEPGRRMFLYGGSVPFGGSPISNDVYVLSLAGTPTWSRIATEAGAMRARLGAFMALDGRARRLVVYGGSAQTPNGWFPIVQELWTLPLDGPPTWTQLPIEPGPAPGPRYTDGSFGWDPARSRVVVHGGATPANVPILETWALTVGDATARWDRLATTGTVPPASGVALVDVARDRLLLTPPGQSAYTAYELPLAPGGEWAPVVGGAPFDPYTSGLRAVDDRRRQRLVLLGKVTTQAFSMADGSGWSRQWPPDPVREPGWTTEQVLVPDAEHQAVWSVGGLERAGFGDLWKLDPAGEALWSWYPQSGRVPDGRHAAALDEEGRRLVVSYLMAGEGKLISIGTEGVPEAVEWTPSGERPARRELHSAVVDPFRRRLIVFGGWLYFGHYSGTNYDDLWTVPLDDPREWTLLTPAGPRPTERGAHFAFFDDVRDRMVMFGGWQSSGGPIRRSRSDAWALALAGEPAWAPLDGAAWMPPVPGNITFDPVTRRLFLYHPREPGGPAETQVYVRGISDDDRWALVPTSGEAPALYGPVVFAPWCDRLVVTSTTVSDPLLDQTWALPIEPVPVAKATLENVHATNARVRLEWRLEGPAAAPLTVSRRAGGAAWQVVARPVPDAQGRLVVEDLDVAEGAQVAYRLNEGARTLARHELGVPQATPLAFRIVNPSPAREMLRLSFALPTTSRVQLELFDVRGARVLERDLGVQEEGVHAYAWPGTVSLEPGFYVARLTALGRQQVARAVRLR